MCRTQIEIFKNRPPDSGFSRIRSRNPAATNGNQLYRITKHKLHVLNMAKYIQPKYWLITHQNYINSQKNRHTTQNPTRFYRTPTNIKTQPKINLKMSTYLVFHPTTRIYNQILQTNTDQLISIFHNSITQFTHKPSNSRTQNPFWFFLLYLQHIHATHTS